MRLIDADALLKVFGFTEDCKKCEHRYNDMLCESVIWRDVCDAIFEAPTIDAVTVVRCKECKWYVRSMIKQDGTLDERYKPDWCDLYRRVREETYFCADGERKDDE